MDIPEFEVTIWRKPHRSDGYLLHMDTSWPEECTTLFRQSLIVVPSSSRSCPEFMADKPYDNLQVSEAWMSDLVALMDRTVISLVELDYTGQFGGTRYGLRVERGAREIQVNWSPKFEDQSAPVRELWSYIDSRFGNSK